MEELADQIPVRWQRPVSFLQPLTISLFGPGLTHGKHDGRVGSLASVQPPEAETSQVEARHASVAGHTLSISAQRSRYQRPSVLSIFGRGTVIFHEVEIGRSALADRSPDFEKGNWRYSFAVLLAASVLASTLCDRRQVQLQPMHAACGTSHRSYSNRSSPAFLLFYPIAVLS